MSTAKAATIPADTASHILIVDDDSRIADLLRRYLRDQGYRVTVVNSAQEARIARSGLSFDLVVLDVMMPGESGFDYLADLRKTSTVPVIMLTARGEVDDRITGLEGGANDYLTKPFEPRELVLRIENTLRSASQGRGPNVDAVDFGDFRYNLKRRELTRDGSIVRLTEREREIMSLLAARPNATVSRYDLLGDDPNKTDRAIDVQMTRLRRKIESDPAAPAYLQTVRGVGYRLVSD
ncbi:MAG: response regulator transcription factor [Devosiaceae bacterium]|nr:response regulator transcription factor [Devosiaceae bacterium MH13]